ncbi:MAG: hypothetical protein AB8G96_14900 [Phycisphaerales bacterium]
MAQAYTPGLKVSPAVTHRVRRVLPISGDVLVAEGDRVVADQVVARTFMPGSITPVNMANQLSVPPGDVKELMLKGEGEAVAVGDPLARTKGMFGLMKTTVTSKHEGTIETLSDVTGQLIIRGEPMPVEVRAYMDGRVVEVIPGEGVVVENDVAFIQGIFGVGGEGHGRLAMVAADPGQELKADMITSEHAGCIVVGGGRVWHEAVRKAIEVGCAAVVAGGIDDQDLREILGYDLGVAITGSEKIGTTLIITEGFGDISMADRTWRMLAAREGSIASVNGATQIRAGVMRPELIVPRTGQEIDAGGDKKYAAGELVMGRPVRIIRDPYFGLLGEVAGLPTDPFVLGSGSKARVLEVALASGERVTVPRANVELIEE